MNDQYGELDQEPNNDFVCACQSKVDPSVTDLIQVNDMYHPNLFRQYWLFHQEKKIMQPCEIVDNLSINVLPLIYLVIHETYLAPELIKKVAMIVFCLMKQDHVNSLVHGIGMIRGCALPAVSLNRENLVTMQNFWKIVKLFTCEKRWVLYYERGTTFYE